MRNQIIQEKNLSYYPKANTSRVNTQIINNSTDIIDNNDIIVMCVYTTNIALSGIIVTDGVTPYVSALVLVTGQTNKTQNGLYVVLSGAWQRLYELRAMMFIKCKYGTLHKYSVWLLISPVEEIRIGTSDIEFQRIDVLLYSVSPLPISNGGTGATTAANARTNLGLGTISTQNANNVNITGGIFNITAAANSGVQIGLNNNVSIKTGNSSSSITIGNYDTTAFIRMISSERWEMKSITSTNPFYNYEATSASNTQPFNIYNRNRNTGHTSIFDRKRVQTTSTLSTSDSLYDEYLIVPTSGVYIQNLISHIVTTADASIPSSSIEFSTTISGALRRIMRLLENGLQLWRNTSNYISILVSNSLTTNYSITLPLNAPTGGQLLSFDGTGQSYFTDTVITTLVNVTSNVTIVSNRHYLVSGNASTRIALTLPNNSNTKQGDYIRVTKLQGQNNTWRISQQSGQKVQWSDAETTTGTDGYVLSNSQDNTVLIMCVETDTNTYSTWQIIQIEGYPILV